MENNRDKLIERLPKDPDLLKRIQRRRRARARMLRAFTRRGLELHVEDWSVFDGAWVPSKRREYFLTFRGLCQLWIQVVRGGRERDQRAWKGA